MYNKPIIKRLEDSTCKLEEVVSLIHLSFQERTQQGILFKCADITPKEYREKTKNGFVLVALDPDDGSLLGTTSVRLFRNAKGQKYGHNEYLAIHPAMKRRGIGTALFREEVAFMREFGAEYILSDTSEKAASSIAYHLKNGFHKIALHSYKGTDYYSVIFRYQITRETLLQKAYARSLPCKILFVASCFKTRLSYKPDGTLTRFGRLIERAH